MEPLSEEHASEIREIVQQEILAALQIVSDEVNRTGEAGKSVSRAINDAAFLYSRRST